jgi:hypothetical protein
MMIGWSLTLMGRNIMITGLVVEEFLGQVEALGLEDSPKNWESAA